MSSRLVDAPLDPGEVRRPRRSTCRPCLLFIVGITGIVILLSLVKLGLGAYKIASKSLNPLNNIYYAGDVAFASPGSYLIPLIDEQQKFDIVFTVWQRFPGSERTGYVVRTRSGKELRTDEELVHSSVVFQGLRMTDKHIRSNVTFLVPLAPFRGEYGNAQMDLRGSFVLIPTSPSKLDYLTGFVSYAHVGTCGDDCVPRSYVSRPWPSEPSEGVEERQKGMRDHAIDVLTFSKPLLDHPIILKENNRTGLLEEVPKDPVSANTSSLQPDPGVNPGLCIVTRMHLRLMQETHPLDAHEFIYRHSNLTARCMDSSDSASHHCPRRYATHGNIESLFQFDGPDEASPTGSRAGLAYGPYLDSLDGGHGPMDCVPLAPHLNSSQADQADHINITMQLTFRGMPVPQAMAADLFAPAMKGSFDAYVASDDQFRVHAQDWTELLHGVGGYRWRGDQHPRRRAALAAIDTILGWIGDALYCLYWFSLQTTAGISTWAIIANAGCRVASHTMDSLKFASREHFSAAILAATAVSAIVALPEPLLELKGALRLRVSWKRWRPAVRRLPATHRERTSERLDGQIPTKFKLLAFVVLACVQALKPWNELYLTAHPPLHTATRKALEVTGGLSRSCSLAAWLVATALQLRLNHAQRQFASRYKLSAALDAVGALVAVLRRAGAVVGHYDTKPGTTLLDVVVWLAIAVRAWQAAVFPSVPKVVKEED